MLTPSISWARAGCKSTPVYECDKLDVCWRADSDAKFKRAFCWASITSGNNCEVPSPTFHFGGGKKVAVRGEGAIGARISVWWPLDEDWYSGCVTAFDAVRQCHTVSYDDGDVEIIRLWAPNQLVNSYRSFTTR